MIIQRNLRTYDWLFFLSLLALMIIGSICGFLFILIQLILLIDFAHRYVFCIEKGHNILVMFFQLEWELGGKGRRWESKALSWSCLFHHDILHSFHCRYHLTLYFLCFSIIMSIEYLLHYPQSHPMSYYFNCLSFTIRSSLSFNIGFITIIICHSLCSLSDMVGNDKWKARYCQRQKEFPFAISFFLTDLKCNPTWKQLNIVGNSTDVITHGHSSVGISSIVALVIFFALIIYSA